MTIRVLLVEDEADKISAIVSCLVEAGLAPDDVATARCGRDARALLANEKFDLLVLDLALPMYEGGDPDPDGGVSLLRDIVTRDIFHLPSSVVGLTQYEDLAEALKDEFGALYWTLDLFDPADDGWRQRLLARAKYLKAERNDHAQHGYRTDVCLMTALQRPELSALQQLPWGWGPAESLDDVTFQFRGRFQSGGRDFSAIVASAPRPGMVSSAILATKLIESHRPRVLGMVGICAGVTGKVNLGDLIFADPVWNWQSGKHSAGVFLQAPDQINASLELRQRFQLLTADTSFRQALYDGYDGVKPPAQPAFHVGPVASGSSVVADGDVTQGVISQHRQVLGVEMEMYGVYCSGREACMPRPLIVGLKSACDFGDEHKDDRLQSYCAYVSATVAKELFERNYCELRTSLDG